MRTSTSLPLTRLRTHTRVLNGSVLWAAVMALMSKRSPLAVLRWWNWMPYHEAPPRSKISRGPSSGIPSSGACSPMPETARS